MPKCSKCPSASISHTFYTPDGKYHLCSYCYNKNALINLRQRMIDAVKDADLDQKNRALAIYALEQIDIYES